MKCPYCGEMIDDNARKCRYCMSWIVSEQPQVVQVQTVQSQTVQPQIVQPQIVYPQTFYYMLVNGKQVGPIGEKDLLTNGLISSTMVWKEGFADWLPAKDVPELQAMLPKVEESGITVIQEQSYYLFINDQQVGPVGQSELLSHGLTPSTMVWRDGMAVWNRAQDVPELMPLLVLQPARQPQVEISGNERHKPFWLNKTLLIVTCCVLILMKLCYVLNQDDYGNPLFPDWILFLIGCVEVLLPMALARILNKYAVETPVNALVIVTAVVCLFEVLSDFVDVLLLLYFDLVICAALVACFVGYRILVSNVRSLKVFSIALICCNLGYAVACLLILLPKDYNLTHYDYLIPQVVLYVFWIYLFVKEVDN